jgi:hypothetical protein
LDTVSIKGGRNMGPAAYEAGMKRAIFMGFLLLGCRGGGGNDAGLPRPVAAPQTPDEPAEAGPPGSGPVDAGPKTTLRDVDGGGYAKAADGSVLFCAIHSVWTPPAGWAVARVGTGVVARKGDALVGLELPPHADASFAAAIAPFVEGTLAWDAPTTKRIDDWHAESTAYGRGNGLVVVALTRYAGLDPKTGKGRAGVAIGAPGADVVWLAAAPTQKEADALLADARAKTRLLVDHACACGYDCYRKH